VDSPLQPAPNFFIVGAPKAGTDSLYYHLDQHPQIFMSPLKEPCYFSSEIRPNNFEPSLREQMVGEQQRTREYLLGPMSEKRFGGIVATWDDYLRLFANSKQETAIGEGSVCYLWSHAAAHAIASRVPSARIIIVLMDPAERAFAQYLKSVSDGTVGHSFREHLRVCFRGRTGDEFSVFNPFLEFGNYSAQVQRYLDTFPRNQINISFYEDAKANYSAWLDQILAFLGVEQHFVPDISKARPDPLIPKVFGAGHRLKRSAAWKKASGLIPRRLRSTLKRMAYRKAGSMSLNPEDRALLVDFYRADIRRLEQVLERDLTVWRR
jgi:hypothetical protein